MEKLKYKPLMIGDYISVKPSGMPIKVAAVHHKKVAYHAVTHKLSWVRESLLEPIPLTSEILEKNGFYENKYGEFILDNDLDESEIYVVLQPDKHGGFWWTINSELITKLQYVHQLQHALRLCGTKKEIIL